MLFVVAGARAPGAAASCLTDVGTALAAHLSSVLASARLSARRCLSFVLCSKCCEEAEGVRGTGEEEPLTSQLSVGAGACHVEASDWPAYEADSFWRKDWGQNRNIDEERDAHSLHCCWLKALDDARRQSVMSGFYDDVSTARMAEKIGGTDREEGKEEEDLEEGKVKAEKAADTIVEGQTSEGLGLGDALGRMGEEAGGREGAAGVIDWLWEAALPAAVMVESEVDVVKAYLTATYAWGEERREREEKEREREGGSGKAEKQSRVEEEKRKEEKENVRTKTGGLIKQEKEEVEDACAMAGAQEEEQKLKGAACDAANARVTAAVGAPAAADNPAAVPVEAATPADAATAAPTPADVAVPASTDAAVSQSMRVSVAECDPDAQENEGEKGGGMKKEEGEGMGVEEKEGGGVTGISVQADGEDTLDSEGGRETGIRNGEEGGDKGEGESGGGEGDDESRAMEGRKHYAEVEVKAEVTSVGSGDEERAAKVEGESGGGGRGEGEGGAGKHAGSAPAVLTACTFDKVKEDEGEGVDGDGDGRGKEAESRSPGDFHRGDGFVFRVDREVGVSMDMGVGDRGGVREDRRLRKGAIRWRWTTRGSRRGACKR